MSLIDIQDLINENEPLASLPNTFYKLREVVHDPGCDFDDIAEIISVDPSLTPRLLKIVNSAFMDSVEKLNRFFMQWELSEQNN